jgi:NADH dehydrogenase
MFLIGWGNRLGTLYNWVRSLRYARHRGHRLINMPTAKAVEEGRGAA